MSSLSGCPLHLVDDDVDVDDVDTYLYLADETMIYLCIMEQDNHPRAW